jgi:hypothetical protein
MVLSRCQIVLAPKEAQEGDELCMFSKHNSAIILREILPIEWALIGNAFCIHYRRKEEEETSRGVEEFAKLSPRL